MKFLLLFFVVYFLIPLSQAQQVLQMDTSAALRVKSALENIYPRQDKHQMLIQKPFYPLSFIKYDQTTWSNRGGRTLHPVVAWGELANKIPFLHPDFPESSIFFMESYNNIEQFWNYLIENFEWEDTSWNIQQCRHNCYNDVYGTANTIETLLNKMEVLIGKCAPGNTTCLQRLSDELADVQTALAEAQNSYTLQKQVMDDHLNNNLQVKIKNTYNILYNNMLKDVSSDSLSDFYPVTFTPSRFMTFMGYTTTVINQFSGTSSLDDWVVNSITVPSFSLCTLSQDSFSDAHQILQLAKELHYAPTQIFANSDKIQVLFQDISSADRFYNTFDLSRESSSSPGCKTVDMELLVGRVTMTRAWMDLTILDQTFGVTGFNKSDWSDGNGFGDFAGFLDGLYVTRFVKLIYYNNSVPQVEAFYDAVSIIAWDVQQLPIFPKLDSKMYGNSTNTTVDYSRFNDSLPFSTTGDDLFTEECCGKPTTYQCTLPRYKIGSDTQNRVINSRDSRINALKILQTDIGSSQSDIMTRSTVVITFSIAFFAFAGLWPIVAVALFVLTYYGYKRAGVIQQKK